MPPVTPADVVAIAPEFAGDPRIASMIAIATRNVNARIWGAKTNDGIIYYTAYLLSLTPLTAGGGTSTTTRGPVTQEKVGDISMSYGSGGSSSSSSSRTSLGESTYGRIFLEMRATLVISPIPVNGYHLSGVPITIRGFGGYYGRR